MCDAMTCCLLVLPLIIFLQPCVFPIKRELDIATKTLIGNTPLLKHAIPHTCSFAFFCVDKGPKGTQGVEESMGVVPCLFAEEKPFKTSLYHIWVNWTFYRELIYHEIEQGTACTNLQFSRFCIIHSSLIMTQKMLHESYMKILHI